MRYPPAASHGHLVWSHYGGTVAVFRVEDPLSYLHLSSDEKHSWMQCIRRAVASVKERPWMILSVCEPTDPQLLSTRIAEGAGPAASAGWARYAAEHATLMTGGQETWERHFYVAVWVDMGSRFTLKNRLSAAVGYVPRPPNPKVVARAERIADDFARVFNASQVAVRPASAKEMWWLYVRAAYRGGVAPVTVSGIPDTDGQQSVRPVVNALFTEGGRASDEDRPFHRRYLRVETEAGVSYQTFLCASRVPLSWGFPDGGGEWWLGAHRFPFPVDWSALIIPTANREARVTAGKQARKLEFQFGEYPNATDVPPEVQRGADQAGSLREELSQSGDPLLRCAMTFCVSARDLTSLEERAATFRDGLETAEWTVPRPAGRQRALYLHMLPGGPTPRVLRDYAQFYLPEALATGMPFAETDVGDPKGQLLGVNADAWSHRPVLFDAAYGASIDRSGSLIITGNLGSGKSYAIKQVGYGTVHRGGRVVVVDRTQRGEYVQFSEAFPDDYVQVVRVDHQAGFSMDPCRVFANVSERSRFAVGFLVSVAGVSSRSDEAALIELAADATVPDGGRISDIVDYLGKLRDDKGHDAGARAGAARLWRQLSLIAKDDIAQVVFARDREPLRLDGRWIVFSLAGLSLPSAEQLANPALHADISKEQIVGQALLYVIAGVARRFCVSDPSVFAAALFDEAWAFTHHQGGAQLISELVRDGRKHNAAAWLMSQHPDDLGDPRLSALFGNRMLFRQGEGAGKTALRSLGVKDPSAAHVRMIESLDTGVCLMRDVRNRVGLVNVMPVDAASDQAAQTTPVAE